MNRIVRKIDSAGLFLEDIIIGEADDLPTGCVETSAPEGLFHPKWNGTSWVEGMAVLEIEAIQTAPIPNADIITEINNATNLTELKTAMLNYLQGGGI